MHLMYWSNATVISNQFILEVFVESKKSNKYCRFSDFSVQNVCLIQKCAQNIQQNTL